MPKKFGIWKGIVLKQARSQPGKLLAWLATPWGVKVLLVMLFPVLTSIALPAVAEQSSESTEKSEIMKGFEDSFSFPYQDLLTKKYPSEIDNFLDGVSVRLAVDYPLIQSAPKPGLGKGSVGQRGSGSPTVQLGLKYNPISSWFGAVTFVDYLHKSWQAPWNPDFSYVFGYDDWHPYTLSLTYANFGGNRLNPDPLKQEHTTRFREGSWALGWKFPLPQVLESVFLLSDKDSMGCRVDLNWTPQYMNLATATMKPNKEVQSLGCKYSFAGWWYFNFTLNRYPDKTQRQPWSPDYTYGFGYFDWHPGTFSLQYNNYSGNRFPGTKPADGTGRFMNGSVSLAWAWSF